MSIFDIASGVPRSLLLCFCLLAGPSFSAHADDDLTPAADVATVLPAETAEEGAVAVQPDGAWRSSVENRLSSMEQSLRRIEDSIRLSTMQHSVDRVEAKVLQATSSAPFVQATSFPTIIQSTPVSGAVVLSEEGIPRSRGGFGDGGSEANTDGGATDVDFIVAPGPIVVSPFSPPFNPIEVTPEDRSPGRPRQPDPILFEDDDVRFGSYRRCFGRRVYKYKVVVRRW